MNIEDYREYCLSLGADVEEKLPFTAFRYASNVLVFYVCGHMFAFLDIDHYSIVTLKCQPERIDELKARYDCIGKPFNLPSKYWIGVDANAAEDTLLRELTKTHTRLSKQNISRRNDRIQEND